MHSFEVAIIAHALANIKNLYFNGEIDCNKIALLALFHDATEIITHDLPTPVKYYGEEMKKAYDNIKEFAKNELLEYLPEDMREIYNPLLTHTKEDEELWKIVKAADRISALIKCLEEKANGNNDFLRAENSIIKSIIASLIFTK